MYLEWSPSVCFGLRLQHDYTFNVIGGKLSYKFFYQGMYLFEKSVTKMMETPRVIFKRGCLNYFLFGIICLNKFIFINISRICIEQKYDIRENMQYSVIIGWIMSPVINPSGSTVSGR